MFYELVDLILQTATDPVQVTAHQARLREARDTLEKFKVAELRDYLRDERFVVERYAVVTTPKLSLTDSRPLDRQGVRVLLSGLSESVQGFPALAHVPAELRSIHARYGVDAPAGTVDVLSASRIPWSQVSSSPRKGGQLQTS